MKQLNLFYTLPQANTKSHLSNNLFWSFHSPTNPVWLSQFFISFEQDYLKLSELSSYIRTHIVSNLSKFLHMYSNVCTKPFPAAYSTYICAFILALIHSDKFTGLWAYACVPVRMGIHVNCALPPLGAGRAMKSIRWLSDSVACMPQSTWVRGFYSHPIATAATNPLFSVIDCESCPFMSRLRTGHCPTFHVQWNLLNRSRMRIGEWVFRNNYLLLVQIFLPFSLIFSFHRLHSFQLFLSFYFILHMIFIIFFPSLKALLFSILVISFTSSFFFYTALLILSWITCFWKKRMICFSLSYFRSLFLILFLPPNTCFLLSFFFLCY